MCLTLCHTIHVAGLGSYLSFLRDNTVPPFESVGADVNSTIDLMFQRNNLASGSLNFYPEAGDICDWNEYYWEVNGVTEPQLIGGHPNFNHTIKATAHRSRLSSLQIEARPR